MMQILVTAIAAVVGLAFGSFLNVCASRWPAGESIIHPRSHCRHCSHTLAWWENVPVLSWLTLRGRCHNCHAWIGWRYPLVELAVGATWGIAAWQALNELYSPEATPPTIFDAVAFCIIKMLLSWLLICIAVIDTEHLWLPDWLTLGGAALGLPLTLVRFSVEWFWVSFPLHWSLEGSSWGNRRTHLYDTVLMWVFGIIAIPALIFLIRWAYQKLRGREGIGFGDVKLMLMMAVWLGLSRTLLAYFLGVVLGAVIALVIVLRPSARYKKTGSLAFTKLPLGAFLSVGGIISALWGSAIITAYLEWCGF